MAFRTETLHVASTGTQKVYTAQPGDLEMWIQSASPFHLRGSDTQPAFQVDSLEDFHTRVRPGDELWVLTTTSNQRLNWLVRSA